ncbi:MAG: hypothetical protein ACI4T8_00915 [Christensenellales bacterium]
MRSQTASTTKYKPLYEVKNEYKINEKHNRWLASVVRIEKGEGLAYTITPKYLTINNLSGDETSDFFHRLDVVLKIGSAEELNTKIGTTATNALIGTEKSPGFVYVLKATGGAGSFGFVTFEKDGKQINALVF